MTNGFGYDVAATGAAVPVDGVTVSDDGVTVLTAVDGGVWKIASILFNISSILSLCINFNATSSTTCRL